jgi:hypothetical protein
MRTGMCSPPPEEGAVEGGKSGSSFIKKKIYIYIHI